MARADKNSITEYLLGGLTEAEEEQVELRLLTDPEFAEEYDIVINEVVDDYVAGKFEGEELKQVEEYFFKSPERKNKLRFALALKQRTSELPSSLDRKRIVDVDDDRSGPAPVPWWHPQAFKSYRPYLAIAATVLLVIGGYYIWFTLSDQSDLNEGLVALRTAFKDERPTEARLSDFTYAPIANQRGGPPKIDYVKRDLAASLLLKEVNQHPSAASHHALGQYYLANRDLDKAIDQLKQAVALDANNAKIHSDLGAALLELGKTRLDDNGRGKGAQAFGESLAHLKKSLERDPNRLEALFNRALVYEHLALLPQAEADWRRYLELDTSSGWATEARQSLKSLEEKKQKTSQSKEEIFQDFLSKYESHEDEAAWNVLSSYHNRTGNVVVEQLLDEYLEARAQNRNDEADSRLQVLSYIGELAKGKSEERFFSDLAASYHESSSEQRHIVRRARSLMKEGYAGWGQLKVDENLNLFTNAKELFDKAGNVAEARVASYWAAFCYYRLHDPNQSQQILEPLFKACEVSKYHWLKARCLYLKSAIEFDLNEHSKAVDLALSCAEFAEKTNDKVGLLNAIGSLVEYYRYLGNYTKALSYIQRAFPLISSIAIDPVQGSRHFGFAASALATVGLYAAAEGYQEEAMRLTAKTRANPALSYAFLGAIKGKQGHFEGALREVETALEMTQSGWSDSAARDALAYALLQRGKIYQEMGKYDEAVTSLNRSIDLYEDLNYPTHLYQAHKIRLLCYIAQKNDELARVELPKTIDLLEDYRKQIREENNRRTFFDVEQSAYDIAIDFEFSRLNNQHQAFNYLTRARARSLQDLLKADTETFSRIHEPDVVIHDVSRPLSLSEITDQMPEEADVLQYAVLEESILVWVISSNRETVIRKESNRAQLTEKIARYLEIVSRANEHERDEELQLAKELFNLLISPIEPFLNKDKQVCIIPDKMLEYLPFAALVSPISGRYLADDFTLVRSPSPSVFLLSTHAASERAGRKSETLLIVGNPRFDRTAFPDLPDLPNARSEAEKAAAFYESAIPVFEREASPARVKDEIPRADVIHLAVHSALDEDVPLRSKLVLAKADSSGTNSVESSVLHAYEIHNLNLSRARLVVLSACETGAERYYGGEGMISLARPFIAAGVPLVVASFWPVDSAATERLMVAFHQSRKGQGMRTADALREAQRALIRSSDARFQRPYYWAAFAVIGGYANF